MPTTPHEQGAPRGDPSSPPRGDPGDAPRTDLPPTREPYDDGYFGTGEEAAVERERQAPDPGADRPEDLRPVDDTPGG